MVGSWHGHAGTFASIQDAVNHASPGDWVLVGPGHYHERGSETAGVLITTPGIHVRGMDRNAVIVDGTRAGAGAGGWPCSADSRDQDAGPLDAHSAPRGRNGIEILAKRTGSSDGVSIENLTACNFLGSPAAKNGNQFWFNGGDGSGHQRLGPFAGSYLTGTTTYLGPPNGSQAQYGIFASNVYGPGTVTHSYASNMADSAFYVGACPDCNTVLSDVHGEHNAVGFSGTNAGGRLIIQGSEFNDNRSGMAPNSLNDDDAPSPQDGACPRGQSPPPGMATCTVITGNHVHDNNDPHAPAAGISSQSPLGIGIEVVGGRNDTIAGNAVDHNGSWGIVVYDNPDPETPPPVANCGGGIELNGAVCYFQAAGNRIIGNRVSQNGFFHQLGNADLANAASSVIPGNCFAANSGRPTSAPPDIQVVDARCGGPSVGDATAGLGLACAGALPGAVVTGTSCPAPTLTGAPDAAAQTILPVAPQVTMADPCAGLPGNPWCPRPSHPSTRHVSRHHGRRRHGLVTPAR